MKISANSQSFISLACIASVLLNLALVTKLVYGHGNDHQSMRLGAREILILDASRRTLQMNQVDGKQLVCSEPSPDVAANVSRDIAARFSIGKGGESLPEAVLQTSGKEVTQLLQLVERSQALQTLRDIIFRACEARLNEFVSADQYASMINHALMTTTGLLSVDAVVKGGVSDEKSRQVLSFMQIISAQP